MVDGFQIEGNVRQVLVASQLGSHISTPVDKATFVCGEGVRHDAHYGRERLLDVRDAAARRFGLLKGMGTFNVRQWSAVSQEDLDETAGLMGIPNIGHGLLGENLVVSGVRNFTRLPPGTQFFFRSPKGEVRTTILFVCGENKPCHIPGDAIQVRYPKELGLRASFVKNAKHRRGLVGFVLGSGIVKKGDTIVVAVPDQQLYDPQA